MYKYERVNKYETPHAACCMPSARMPPGASEPRGDRVMMVIVDSTRPYARKMERMTIRDFDPEKKDPFYKVPSRL